VALYADHAKAIELLWGQRTAPKRGPKPALSLDAIATTGIEIADSHGLGAVTMQRIADALGVTKMALYRYVPSKVELVALMTDAGLGEPPPFDTLPSGWRARLHDWALRLFERFRRHPWALESTVGVRAIGPNELSWLEQAVAALMGTALHGGEILDVAARSRPGLNGGEILDVAVTLVGHVRTIAQQVTATGGPTPEQDVTASLAALVCGREDRFPALSAALAGATTPELQNQALDFGLSRILDGVELLITTRAALAPRPH
jgi:AcrR family transcriptional regulator